MAETIPSLSPEQYSQGQGSGYAQVFNLGAPNPFNVANQYAQQALAQKERQLARKLGNEEKRQERLSELNSFVDGLDPKWFHAQREFEGLVDEYGNFISEHRALGKPLDANFYRDLAKLKTKINTKKSENEKAFTMNFQNMKEMADHPDIYSDDDVKEYNEGVEKAFEGGIDKGFKYVTEWKKRMENIDVAKDFVAKGFLPKAKDKTGYLTSTDDAEMRQSTTSYVTGLTDLEKQQLARQYIKNDVLDVEALDALKNGDKAVLNDLSNLVYNDTKHLMEYNKDIVSPRSSNGPAWLQNQGSFTAQPNPDFPDKPKVAWRFALQTKGNSQLQARAYDDGQGNQVYMIPSVLQFDKADGNAPSGWFIHGKVQQEKGTKPATAFSSSDPESVLQSYNSGKKDKADYAQFDSDKNEWIFYTLQKRRVPLKYNEAVLEGQVGISDPESMARNAGYLRAIQESDYSNTQSNNQKSKPKSEVASKLASLNGVPQ